MNKTTDYYNRAAESYFQSTEGADFTEAYERFLKYVPEGGRIMDAGCGSGRDAAAFNRKGYRAEGIDTSAELARLAKENFGIKVTVCNMANWRANHPYDGIWCCASLLHLSDDEIQAFFRNLQGNLTSSGTFFLSVKTGIETGYDNKGRYMRNFTECELRKLIKTAGLIIREYWLTEDKLNRSGFRWINVIAACDPAG